MYAGGISYLSSCAFGFIGCVSAEPVTIAVRETGKIEKMLDIVEDLIKCEVVGAERWSGQAHAIPRHPESPHWRPFLIRNSNLVENYVRLIGDEIVT